MEPLRPALWNVPDWARLVMYVSNAIGVAILLGRLYQRAQLWLKGQGGLPFDHFWQRVGRTLKYAGAQVRISRQRYAGIMHYSIFLAFVFLFIGTTLALLDYDVADLIFNVRLLKGDFYLVFELVLDFFAVVGTIGLALAIGRRLFARPKKLTLSLSFDTMLVYFLSLFVVGLLIELLRLTATEPPWRTWSFAGYAISRGILALNLPLQTVVGLHRGLWVFHVLQVAVLYVVFLDLPTKHIIYSPLNVFFSSFRAPGALAPIDLEDDTREVFGVASIADFAPFQLLNGDACTECGRCQAVCPAYMAGTPLNPKQVILDIRAGLTHYAPDLLGTHPENLPEMPVTRDFVSEGALWACTTCRACVYECPVLIEHVDAIVDMRRSLVLMDGDLPDLLGTAMTQAERSGSPWGNPRGSRMDWAQGLDVPLMSQKRKADVLYWVGCAGAYDPESQKTTRAMVRILQAAGIDFAVLGEEERCNCEWARRAGNEYLYQEATHSNIAVFDQYEFQTIITHCPHCFNTFRNEYPQFGGSYDVVHHSTYITRLIADGHLRLRKMADQMLTYHDSCYLGRYNEVYDDPRDALKAIQGVHVVEMARSRQNGLCCGGGGAQVWFETPQQTPVSEIRLEEAMGTGAHTVAAACPFCSIMLGSAAQSKGVTGEVAVRDIAQIVAEALL